MCSKNDSIFAKNVLNTTKETMILKGMTLKLKVSADVEALNECRSGLFRILILDSEVENWAICGFFFFCINVIFPSVADWHVSSRLG